MKIILLGPPGAGKGTQAQLLKEKLGLRHISTGDIFRKLILNASSLGLKIKQYVESGKLVPDEIVLDVLISEIKGLDLNKGFVLDGFPRTLKQAEMLKGEFENMAIIIDKVFYFETSEPVIIKRLSGRRICSKCGTNYHLENMPPKKKGLCDKCGNELYQRKDDNEATVHNRLEIYKKETQALIVYYKKLGLLETVNGDLSKDEGFGILQEKLLEHQK